jgi:hypothetical protein
MDVAAWARERGYPVKLLHPPVIGEVIPHITGEIAWEYFTAHRAVLERPQALVTIEGATIRDLIGLVELPDRQICYEGNWWLPYLQEHPAYKRQFALRRRKLSGNIYSLLCLWAPEFYHWFHDVLPRLETALPHLPADTKFLINSDPNAWQLDSLIAFGIGPNQLETQSGCMHTRVERLWFATPVGQTCFGSGTVIRKVADRLRRHFIGDNSRQGASHRLYISRRKAALRRIVNESDITPVLETHGVETLVSEDLSLAEQIRLFAKTTAVIGAHGAGLINLIYCAPGSYVGEINTGRVFSHYLVMARQLDMRFSHFEADPIPLGGNHFDMQVNVPGFRKWLSEGLGPTRGTQASHAEASSFVDATQAPDYK